MTLYPKLIVDALATVVYPGTKKNLIESEMLADTPSIDGMNVRIILVFPRDTDPFLRSTVKAAEAAIHYHISPDVKVTIETEFKSKPRPEVGKMLPNVKNIIAVSSGKGGVGKSTVAVNLAISLVRLGYKVGLLDSDVLGPSIPKMFDVENERPYASEDADWGELDYFIIDTPPGTGDIHLTLLQTLSITGAIIISTPQAVALADARKGIDMYQNDKVNVPILGLVENMAWFTPAELPENKYYIFGKEGCKNLAKEMGVPLLAQLPIVQSICENGDEGRPSALDAETITGQAFLSLAQAVVTVTNRRNKELAPTRIVDVKRAN